MTTSSNLSGIVMQLNFSDFKQQFINYNRQDNFSHLGLESLFEQLEQISDDTGMPFVLDVIGLCCDFSESSANEVIKDYCLDASDIDSDDIDSLNDFVLDYLQENTMAWTVTDHKGDIISFIYQAF